MCYHLKLMVSNYTLIKPQDSKPPKNSGDLDEGNYQGITQEFNVESQKIIDHDFHNQNFLGCLTPCFHDLSQSENEPGCLSNAIQSWLCPCCNVYYTTKYINELTNSADNECLNTIESEWTYGMFSGTGCLLYYIYAFTPSSPVLLPISSLMVAISSCMTGLRWKNYRDDVRVAPKKDWGKYFFVACNGFLFSPCLLFETYQQSSVIHGAQNQIIPAANFATKT